MLASIDRGPVCELKVGSCKVLAPARLAGGRPVRARANQVRRYGRPCNVSCAAAPAAAATTVPPPSVRRFRPSSDPASLARAVTTMADALQNDPTTCYYCWPYCNRGFFSSVLNATLATGGPEGHELFSVEGEAAVAVCCFYPPKLYLMPSLVDTVLVPLMMVRWDRIPAMLDTAEWLDNAKTKFGKEHGPFLYIHVLATSPAHQRRGLGSAILAEVSQLADATGKYIYLEASSPGSRDLYLRSGFEVLGSGCPRPDAPPIWIMARPPILRATEGSIEAAAAGAEGVAGAAGAGAGAGATP